MGVPPTTKALAYQESDSREHSDFSDHTGLPASTILLSSFVDPAGGSNAAGETETGFPLVHYLFLDHESKAVVLTLRGTWGFEDILTDMTCDYDDLEWQGKSWKVHKVAFKSDVSGTKSHVQGRVWNSLRQSIVNKFYVNEPPIVQHAGDGIGEDAWAWKTLKMLREEMLAPKLMPPGEVFVVETMRVLQRDAFTSGMGDDGHPRLGRPATRVQLKFIRDVESVFGEMRFGSGMFSDHNPARYEASLAALSRGILDD
ncbi:lipase [Aspergillus bombycis]|uniref:Lipase n=1 Tax=Aspergillus bombycis TaxID=109264 RepID=A0A1F7ZMV1_9EURO|nr:lipase [Aspergillus bombycis]OGM40458.1 lipase [Aspergillus bombycis]